MILDVGQRLCRCDRDRIACVHAHRVEILDRADDDDVVVQIAHHLKLEFLPPKYRFFDQYLRIRRRGKSIFGDLLKFFGIIRRAAARAAKRKTWTNDGRITDAVYHPFGLFPRVCKSAFCRRNTDLVHRRFEKFAVLADPDRVDICADQLDAEFVENSLLVQFDRKVQPRLSANGRQQCIGPLLLDYRGQRLDGQRFDIGAVGDVWIGHDRRRI